MPDLSALLTLSSTRHSHLCPRQVLGVRMALAGAAALDLDLPRQDKRMLVIAETDGCFVDGLEVTAGISAGHRTLRIEDYGKVAATFIDTQTRKTLRLAPKLGVRELARSFAPDEPRHYFAQLKGYQVMPDDALFSITSVTLTVPIEQIVSRPDVRVNCCACGEEIINEREIAYQGKAFCRSCLGRGYYQMESVETLIAAGDLFPPALLDAQAFSHI
jgi:formylmethanofuran dehydrogenase subunit E